MPPGSRATWANVKRMVLGAVLAASLLAVPSVGQLPDVNIPCAAALSAPNIFYTSSNPGDSRKFALALQPNPTAGVVPVVALLPFEGDSYAQLAEELARNLAAASGYAMVLNSSSIVLEAGTTTGAKLEQHLEYIKPAVEAALDKQIVPDLPGPAVFTNLLDSVASVGSAALSDIFYPSNKNYIVLGFNDGGSMALELAEEGWPAGVAVSPENHLLSAEGTEYTNYTLEEDTLILSSGVATNLTQALQQQSGILKIVSTIVETSTSVLQFIPLDSVVAMRPEINLPVSDGWKNVWSTVVSYVKLAAGNAQVVGAEDILEDVEYCSLTGAFGNDDSGASGLTIFQPCTLLWYLGALILSVVAMWHC